MKRILFIWLISIQITSVFVYSSAQESSLTKFYRQANVVGQIDLVETTQLLPSIKLHKLICSSLRWPNDQSIWTHRVNLHIPELLTNPQAVIFVNGGVNFYPSSIEKGDVYDDNQIPFALSLFALQHGVMVIEIKDIPNQYLSLKPNEYLREDAILARSMKKALQHNDPFMAVHLPMAKSISLCLDAIQSQEDKLQFTMPKQFLITGLSKRSWASWLALIEDKRINAIVQGALNLMDQENTLIHNKKSLGYWPEAFYPYVREGVAVQVQTEPYSQLMDSIDPWQYSLRPEYKARFSAPKLILSASNDEFLVPDSQNHILDDLKGPTFIRILPNSSHYLNFKAYMQTVSSFLQYVNGQTDLADIQWQLDGSLLVSATTNKKPKSVNFWVAHNPEWRDFRKTTGIKYTKTTLTPTYSKGEWVVSSPKLPDKEGYYAHFIEFIFDNAVLTTPAFISPDSYPDKQREFELSPGYQKRITRHFHNVKATE